MDQVHQEPPGLQQTQLEFTQPLPYDSMPKTIRREERQYFVPSNSNQNNMAGYSTMETYYSGSDLPAQTSNSWPTWPQTEQTQTLPGYTQPEEEYRSSSQTSTIDLNGILPVNPQQPPPGGLYPSASQASQPHTWTPGYTATPQYYSNNMTYYGNSGHPGNYGGNNGNIYSSNNGGYFQPAYNQPVVPPTYSHRYDPGVRSFYRPRGRPPGRGGSYSYSHLHHSNSAPPTASNSINGIANHSASGLLLPQLLGEEDEEFAFAYPHVMEENDEPFEYTIEGSMRPETLQEAISMYIDYIIAENEHKTRISQSLPADIQAPIVDEPYYQAVVGKSIPFPTEKFLKWLKLFNLDIEITDLEGNTTPQTVFEPTEPMAPPKSQPTHVMNWQTLGGPVQPGGCETSAAVRSLISAEPGNKHTINQTNGKYGVNKQKREGQVFETSAGTKFMVCEVEPDSTSEGSAVIAPPQPENNNSDSRLTQVVGGLASQRVLSQTDPSVSCMPVSQPQARPTEFCDQTSETLGQGGSIVESLMGKSTKDIFKNSPASKTMMSLCELVVSDHVGTKIKGPPTQEAEAKLPKVDVSTETTDINLGDHLQQSQTVDLSNNIVFDPVISGSVNGDTVSHPDTTYTNQNVGTVYKVEEDIHVEEEEIDQHDQTIEKRVLRKRPAKDPCLAEHSRVCSSSGPARKTRSSTRV